MNTPNSIPSRPVFNRLLLSCRVAIVASLVFIAGVLTSPAANITLSGSDGFGVSSFSSGTHWNNGQPPAAGSNYFTGANVLRTIGDTTGGNNYVFAGDSLSVDTGGRLLGKIGNGVAGATTSDTVTINNLILNGGNTEQADTTTDSSTMILAGNISVNAASGIGAEGDVVNGSLNFDILNVTAVISGSAALTVAGSTVNGNADSGVVQFSAANPYSGTIQVSNNIIASTANRLLQLNNLDAVSNATVNLVGSLASPMSFASGANSGTFNVGAVTGTANQTLTDSSGAAVTVRVGGNNSSSTYSAGFKDSGNLIKAGTGTFTLAGTNTYTGFTVVSNGTLTLASGAMLTNSSGITVNSGATFNLSSNAFTLAASQNLLGSGTVKGSVNAASGAGIYGGLDLAYGTNTITTNLTMSAGASVYLDLGTTHNGQNDLIAVGGNLTLNSTVFHLKAPSMSVNLDTTDYVLTSVGGTTTGNPSLAWDVAPLNSAHYSIGKSGNNIVLHYNSSLVPSGTGVASPNSVMHNQPVLITVTVTFSSNPINTVTVDASALGASSSLPLISAGSGNYTNTVGVASSTALGPQTLVATITDSGSLVGTTPSFTVTVNTSSDVWNGGGANNLWSSNPNWQSGYAPGYVGDSLTFADTTRLTPDMNASYTISTLTFDGTAGSFTLGSSGGYGLTITDGSIANNSANTQTLNLAIANAGNLLDVSGGNNIVFNGGIAGAGGLQNDNSGALILNGTNTFTGGIDIENGTLQIAGAGLLGDTNGNYSGNITNLSVFQYSSSATQTLAGVISFFGPIKDGSGKLILTGTNTYIYDTVVSSGVLQIAGAGGLGYGNAGAGSTVFDYTYGNLIVNGTFEYSSSAAQIIEKPITGTGGLLVDGSGTLTLNGDNTSPAYSGPTVVSGGTLVYSPNTITYSTIHSLSISNGTVLVNVNNGASLPIGNLTLNSNSVLKLSYDFSSGNPTVAAVGVNNISAPGTNIVIRIIGFGAAVGQFPLISYTGTPLANLNNFVLSSPAGVTAKLTNNTANKTIDINITASSPTTWIPLTAGDGTGSSSFNSIGNWYGGSAPTSGNGYYTQGYILRTPADSSPYTFGGSALSIDYYTPGSGSSGGRLLMKGSGGAVITITNLILNGGLVDYANLGSDFGIETLAGKITLNGGTTSYLGALEGETLLVTAPIGGTGNLQFGGVDINGGVDHSVVALLGANAYSGSTTVATGTLLANGTIPNTPGVIVFTNATLGGTNSIGGAVTVQAGGTLAPGISALATMWTNNIGTLTVGGAVSVSGAVVIKINDGVSPNGDKLVAPSVTISSGATLTVNNIGSTNLVAGDTFTLFSTPVSGLFTAVTLPALPATNLAWTNKLAVNGSIAVVSVATVNTNPTNITFTVSSGNQLILSWPADHIGWHLQVQTNSLSTGLGTNWVTIPGTDAAGSYTNTINPVSGAVFYRQVYP